VCTNGKHDPCCADLGRPVVRALSAAGCPDVWECSHVGGDRFAANVVCLPDGVYFGRVEPEHAATLVTDYRDGQLDLDCYRGRSCFPPLLQAAEVFARRHLDDRSIDGLTVLEVLSRQDDRFDVRFLQKGGRQVEVVVAREPGEPEPLTCFSDQFATPWRYRLVELTAR
jgi:Sucrase/ferredoxin-like